MLAVTASSPSFVAVGSVLQIPMSAAADYMLHGETLDAASCLGYVLIALGFLVFSLQGRCEQASWMPRFLGHRQVSASEVDRCSGVASIPDYQQQPK